MLLRFKVSNFLSFRDEIEFTTVATREQKHRDRVFPIGSIPGSLLPISAIFGGNASGKSNFYQAIEFLRDLVLETGSNPGERIPLHPFRLDDSCSTRPTVFSIDFQPIDDVFRLNVTIDSRGVVEESLEIVKDRFTQLVYSRSRKFGADQHHWNIARLKSQLSSERDRQFVEFKTRDTLPNELFLRVLWGKGIGIVDEATRWFRDQISFMLPTVRMETLEVRLSLLEKQEDFGRFCNELLRNAGTGIHEIKAQDVDWDSFHAPADLKRELEKDLENGQVAFLIDPSTKNRYSVRNEAGKIKVSRIFTTHEMSTGGTRIFELHEESEGTQRLIDLLPAFYEMTQSNLRKVIIVDELDRSLHVMLTKSLVETYLKQTRFSSGSQLIFTTHDVMLLKSGSLRRDEIWFMERNRAGSSGISRLSDYEGVRADTDILRGYLNSDYVEPLNQPTPTLRQGELF